RDDVPAVRGLRLDQPSGAVDPEPDAVPGHSELQLPRDAWAEVPSVRGRRDQEYVWPHRFDHRTQRRAPGVRVGFGGAVVVGQHDAVGPAAGELGCDAVELRAEHEPDVVAPELAGKLAPLAEQLERVPRGPAAGKLDERPAVVALRRRLFAEPLGFLPAARVGRALGGELADARRGGGEVCEPLTAAWRRDVPHREHASRGSRLAETLV